MLRALTKLYKYIYPPFLKRWEDWMLVRYPGLWGMSVPAILFFGTIMNIVAAAIVWLYPIDFDNLPPMEIWSILAIFLGIMLIVVWMVTSAKFDPAVYYGDNKSLTVRLRPFVYLLAVSFLMGPAGTIYFQFNIRVGLMSETEQFKQDLAVVRNYSAFQAGDIGYNRVQFLKGINREPLTDTLSGAPDAGIPVKVDTTTIISRLMEIEAKYDGDQKTKVQQKAPIQQVIQEPEPDPAIMTGDVPDEEMITGDTMADSPMGGFIQASYGSREVEPAQVEGLTVDTITLKAHFSEVSVLSPQTFANFSRLEGILSQNIHEDWFDWLLFMATYGVLIAFFIAIMEFSSRYLGPWYGLLTIGGIFIGGLIFMIFGSILAPFARALLDLVFPPDPTTGHSVFNMGLLSYQGGIPFIIIITLILDRTFARRIKLGGRRTKWIMAILPGLMFTSIISLLINVNDIAGKKIHSWEQIGMLTLFFGALIFYSITLPYLKRRYYSVYLLPH